MSLPDAEPVEEGEPVERGAESRSKGEARRYSWPPFEKGHTLSMRHGAYSPRRIDPRAELVVAGLLEDETLAFLRAAAFRPAVWRYAQRQARADLLHDWLVQHGEECQGCDRCLEWERRWREFDTAADKAGQRLGLDPLSRARLGKDVAQGRQADAAAIMAELHRMEREGKAEGEGS